MKINANFAQVKAKTLQNAQIVDNNRTLNWSAYEKREVKHAQPINLKKESWALVYGNKDFNNANTLLAQMQKASAGFGIRVDEPQWVELPYNDQPNDYNDAIKSDIDPQFTTLVVVILKRKEIKPQIKKFIDALGIPS